jgi:hypothetical protein
MKKFRLFHKHFENHPGWALHSELALYGGTIAIVLLVKKMHNLPLKVTTGTLRGPAAP